MRIFLYLSLLFMSIHAFGQQTIDGGFPFQTDNFKKYSLYVPSSYDASVPQPLMLGLHPLNINRWDGEAWRDTLIQFAEMNNLLLVCPDGGPDGRIDDAIDTAFTSVLLDSVGTWYNVDDEEKYIMGFSWGGRTSYTYGLRRNDQFKGYLIIGAAINGVSEVQSIIQNAKDEAFYIIHGSNDAPATRYFPIVESLFDNGACVETNFLQGVGHTIDFPNRNSILTDAFQWLASQNCGISITTEIQDNNVILFPNPNHGQFEVSGIDTNHSQIELFTASGQKIAFQQRDNMIDIAEDYKGLLYLIINSPDSKKVLKILVQ